MRLSGPGTCKPEDLEAFLVGCECIDNCRDPAECECQRDHDGDPLAMYNKVPIHFVTFDIELSVAYHQQGKFLFKNEGYEVNECNKVCGAMTPPCALLKYICRTAPAKRIASTGLRNDLERSACKFSRLKAMDGVLECRIMSKKAQCWACILGMSSPGESSIR